MRGLLVAALLAVPLFSGCLSNGSGDSLDDGLPGALVPVQERHLLPYNVTGDWSHTLAPGVFGVLPAVSVDVPVQLPLEDLGANADPNGPHINLGLFLPDVPAGTKVPVIADVGPYYRGTTGVEPHDGLPAGSPELDTPATEPANRLGRFLIENFVPHGYAVAQVSVFGTGDSNHCFDYMGTAEQAGVNAAVEWLGTQDWSNGNVSLIGRSYDGSTAWQAATFGNPHLKTIVPISGITSTEELVTHNGSSDLRVFIFPYAGYGGYGIDGEPEDIQNACPDFAGTLGYDAALYLAGHDPIPVDETYWRERDFMPRVLENYEGSVYFIHGLQDWNVVPRMANHYRSLEEAGLEVKGLFGQWAHNYPDRMGEHESCDGANYCRSPDSVRYDWAQDLLEWFDHYLKGTGPKPALHVEVQDSAGRWRVEPTFPAPDVERRAVPVGTGQVTLFEAGAPLPLPGSPQASHVAELPPLSLTEDTLLSGHAYLQAAVIPSGPNGQVYFEMHDLENSSRRLAFGVLDLRYRDGEAAQPATPQQEVTVHVQSMPFDFVLEAGHGIRLTIATSGERYLPAASGAPVTLNLDATQLLLPVRAPEPGSFFLPPVPMADIEGSGTSA